MKCIFAPEINYLDLIYLKIRNLMFKSSTFLTAILLTSLSLFGQNKDTLLNSAQTMMAKSNRLTIGGYAEIDYNQPFGNSTIQNGQLDVHRLVMLFGYKFNNKTQFITEIEFEHVKEVFVEQAFLSHKLAKNMNLNAGLILIPMGIINEYHEPTTFNGVERPNLDKFIVPTTWREIGIGLSGRIPNLSLRYQAYLVNGLASYNGNALISGKNGFRSGRQKGAEGFASAPNFTAKAEYYGFGNFKFGLSTYLGKTQSTLFDGIERGDEFAISQADSSVVGLYLTGADFRFNKGGFQARGQFNYGFVTNSAAYNQFAGSDVGSAIGGYYLEAGYNVLHSIEKTKYQLIAFTRFEQYNTHQSTDIIEQNDAFNRQEITTGLTWKLSPGAALKADYQWFNNSAPDKAAHQINFGVGIWFN